MQPSLLATLLLLPLLAVTSASDAAGEAYLTANKAKPGVVALPSGLQYEVLRKGKGFKKVEVRVLITRPLHVGRASFAGTPPPTVAAGPYFPPRWPRAQRRRVCRTCTLYAVHCTMYTLLCHYM